MELIPLLVFSFEILLKLLPYAAPIGGLIIGWHKDEIMKKFNMKKANAEAESSTADTIEKNLLLYQKMLDDYQARKEAEDVLQRERIQKLEFEVRSIGSKNMELIEENRVIEAEKLHLKDTVDRLEKHVEKLSTLIERLGKKIEYYENNSGVELPDDLKDNKTE